MVGIQFQINNRRCTVDCSTPRETTLNAYIRYVLGLSGTKSMCLEGGCGACIVMVRAKRYPSGSIETFSVNSCLVLVWSCSGWEVTTVEGLGDRERGYSAVQRRLAAFNGTQCGYCSPGWVMQMTRRAAFCYRRVDSSPRLWSTADVDCSCASARNDNTHARGCGRVDSIRRHKGIDSKMLPVCKRP